MISDPWFYLTAIPAVVLTGLFKGAFGLGLGILAVPLMSLYVPPPQAAGIMLPLLCLMDLFGLWAYRRHASWRVLKVALPAAMVGIAVGTLTFHLLSENAIRLLIGAIAVGFTVNHWLGGLRRKRAPGQAPGVLRGSFWSAVAGFTSFVAHSGGPPFSVYMLPQRLDKRVFAGTSVVFFAVVNYVKLVPYAWLGQLGATNLETALVLTPLVPLCIGLGVWLNRRIALGSFYRAAYLLVFFSGLKLLHDGAGLFFPGG